jgi:putative flippase GtrA
MSSYSRFANLNRFIIVGSVAASVHFLTVVWLVQYAAWLPLWGNFLGFLLGFQISYWGHRLWTFAAVNRSGQNTYVKLLLLQIINLGVSQISYQFLLHFFQYQIALLILLLLFPFLTFFISKHWIFNAHV